MQIISHLHHDYAYFHTLCTTFPRHPAPHFTPQKKSDTMSMSMNSLPAIPEEIRQLIGCYLDRETLGVAIQVCRSFHLSFIPLLWKQAEIRGVGGVGGVGGGEGVDSSKSFAHSDIDRNHLLTPPVTPTTNDKDEPTWLSLSPASSSSLIDLSLLQARSRHIEHLTISGLIPSLYCSIVFPKLRTLILTEAFNIIGGESAMQQDMVRMARLNPTIERLTINNILPSFSAQFWETVFFHWRNPKSLVIRYSPVAKSSAAALWKASTRFEELEFRGVDLPRYSSTTTAASTSNASDVVVSLPSPPASSDDDSDSGDKRSSSPFFLITSFPRVRRVHLSITPRLHPFFNPTQQLIMMQSCPQLRELVWDGSRFHIDPQLASQFISSLTHPPRNTSSSSLSPSSSPSSPSTCWPLLESLVLLNISFRRSDPHRRHRLAEILLSTPQPLKSLTLQGGIWEEPFAMMAMKERGHLKSLQSLSVRGCKGFSSSMCLMLCEGLVEFSADFIFAQDVVVPISSSSYRERGSGSDSGTGAVGSSLSSHATGMGDSIGGGGRVKVQPWACKGLKSLKICIYTTALDAKPNTPSCARNVLKQIATLTQLEHLDLRRNLVDDRNLLNLSLESGLDALDALIRLKTFRSEGKREGGMMMMMMEMFWMWRMLEEVSGPFLRRSRILSENEAEDEVGAVFREHHVVYSV
ncbi:MAG: LOW QUALITY PROTEIN: hypothetical protein J3R72DRAFT_460736 [Linnemannia gamsii]|nr:MAG: LOW QUALITY PROTEIN: hypothetical protein J3R72DRAFT_460736 [Linnemannia gamsii]